jgi:hypothetical protein
VDKRKGKTSVELWAKSSSLYPWTAVFYPQPKAPSDKESALDFYLFVVDLEFGLIWIQPAIKRAARQSYPTS